MQFLAYRTGMLLLSRFSKLSAERALSCLPDAMGTADSAQNLVLPFASITGCNFVLPSASFFRGALLSFPAFSRHCHPLLLPHLSSGRYKL